MKIIIVLIISFLAASASLYEDPDTIVLIEVPETVSQAPQEPIKEEVVVEPTKTVKEKPTPPTPKVSGNHDCSLVYNYNNWDHNIAYAVCMAESGGNASAANWNDNHGVCVGSHGLMQLACLHASRGDIYNPVENIRIANQLYQEQGWGIWGAFTNQSFRRYL